MQNKNKGNSSPLTFLFSRTFITHDFTHTRVFLPVCVCVFVLFVCCSFSFVSCKLYRCHLSFIASFFEHFIRFNYLKFNCTKWIRSKSRSHQFELQKEIRDWNTKWQFWFLALELYSTCITHKHTHRWMHPFKLVRACVQCVWPIRVWIWRRYYSVKWTRFGRKRL